MNITHTTPSQRLPTEPLTTDWPPPTSGIGLWRKEALWIALSRGFGKILQIAN